MASRTIVSTHVGLDIGLTTGFACIFRLDTGELDVVAYESEEIHLLDSWEGYPITVEYPIQTSRNRWTDGLQETIIGWEILLAPHSPQLVSPGTWKPSIQRRSKYKALLKGIRSPHTKDAIGIAYWSMLREIALNPS
jgi:hypothetical protein